MCVYMFQCCKSIYILPRFEKICSLKIIGMKIRDLFYRLMIWKPLFSEVICNKKWGGQGATLK